LEITSFCHRFGESVSDALKPVKTRGKKPGNSSSIPSLNQTRKQLVVETKEKNQKLLEFCEASLKLSHGTGCTSGAHWKEPKLTTWAKVDR